MAVIRPRTKLVHCRVSEDEFAHFSRLCEREGARSISDLVRVAMQRMMRENMKLGDQASPDAVEQRLSRLDEIIAELNEKLREVNGLLQHTEHRDRNGHQEKVGQ